jgi:hypothetical protein
MTVNKNLLDLYVHVGLLTGREKLQSQGIVIFFVESTDTVSLTNTKTYQLSKNDSNQSYIKHDLSLNVHH